MTKRLSYPLLLSLLFLAAPWSRLAAQEERDTTVRPVDTTVVVPVDTSVSTATDTMAIQVANTVDSTFYNHSPRKAAIRSAIIPGWGQVYNRQIWKVPIVWGALGTTAYIFVNNIKTYRELRLAYSGHYNASRPVQPGQRRDSTDYWAMKPKYRLYDAESIRYYRNEYRKNVDYSVLVFLVFWGLNVADAAAAAHLRTFDVSPDLTFQIKPGRSPIGGTHGLSLVLAFK